MKKLYDDYPRSGEIINGAMHYLQASNVPQCRRYANTSCRRDRMCVCLQTAEKLCNVAADPESADRTDEVCVDSALRKRQCLCIMLLVPFCCNTCFSVTISRVDCGKISLATYHAALNGVHWLLGRSVESTPRQSYRRMPSTEGQVRPLVTDRIYYPTDGSNMPWPYLY